MIFANRSDAGRRLAVRLGHLRGQDLVVLGLPRGGVPVAFEVARALAAPLDVIVVRKLGVPFQPELAMGAIGEEGARQINHEVLSRAGVDPDELAVIERAERAELERRVRRFRGGHPRVPLSGRTAVIVDDGIATGSTAQAACQVARGLGAARVVIGVPVAPPTAVRELSRVADEVVCLATPEWFAAVGQWYHDFTQVADEQVVELLDLAAKSAAGGPANPHHGVTDPEVSIQVGAANLAGRLTLVPDPSGLVVFAHGSGSSRHSPRNRYVADVLVEAGIGTLLFDLLTAEEEVDRANVFDIGLLADRLAATLRWLRGSGQADGLPVGLFGASTGAAAALLAAAEPDSGVAAVVSRGGRPDLAGDRLAAVRAPTLLIVGGLDHAVLALNRDAAARLRCVNRLEVVPGATHLFEEPGTLTRAAGLAVDWFREHLASARPSPASRAGEST